MEGEKKEVDKKESTRTEFGLEDRISLAEKYQEHVKQEEAKERPKELPAVKSPAEETPKEVSDVETKTVTPTTKGDAVAPTEKDSSEKSVKEEKLKIVPHAALHEERLRHKETRQELEKIKNEHESILDEIKSLKEDREAGVGTIEDNDAKYRQLENKLNRLERDYARKVEDDRRSYMAQKQMELDQKIRSTNDELLSEGLKGFDIFKAQVAEELKTLVEEDPANVHLDNPEGWKKIYKEKVYPKVSSIFAEKVREEKDKEKDALAESAKLASSPGTGPTKAPEEEKTPHEKYMEMRRERAASSI